MRDPLNRKEVVLDTNKKITIKLHELPEYDREDYDLNIPKSYDAFIKDVKTDARGSFEYKQFMEYFKRYLDMNKCSFFENVNGYQYEHVKIEIHHDPFTIEDIIRIVVRKRLAMLENFDVPMVSKEVVYLHYLLMVGLIPLSKTVHQLVGNSYLFVPTTHVMGNYKSFVEMYSDFIEPEQKEMLERIEQATAVYNEAENKKILDVNYIYIDMEGDQYKLPSYDKIIALMQDKIDSLNSRPPVELTQVDSNKPKYGFVLNPNGFNNV